LLVAAPEADGSVAANRVTQLREHLDAAECQGQQRAVLEAAVTSSIAHQNVVRTCVGVGGVASVLV